MTNLDIETVNLYSEVFILLNDCNKIEIEMIESNGGNDHEIKKEACYC